MQNSPSPMRRSLTRDERLRARRDLRRVFVSRRQVSCPGVKIKFVKNELGRDRFAVSVSRSFGNAVVRNRAKRIVREIYRNMKHELRDGFDLVIILYPGAATYSERKGQLHSLFRKAGLIR